MVREVGITQQRLITPEIRSVTPVDSGAALNAINNFAQGISNTIRNQAETNYKLKIQTEMRQQISRIERENPGDPEKMQAALNNYRDVLTESVPFPALRADIDHKFTTQSIPVLNRAYTARRKVLDTETETQALLAFDQAQNDMLKLGPLLFTNGAEAGTAEGKHMLALNVIRREGAFV